jgi:hypothetical protein
VVAAGVGLVFGGVVALELVPLEAGGDPVGGGDDPLQEAVRLVVHGGRVDEGVGDVDAPARLAKGHVAADEVGGVGLDALEHQRSPGGVAMAVVAPFAEGAVLGDVGVEAVAVDVGRGGTLGELAEVVEEGGKGDPTGCGKLGMLIVHGGVSGMRRG